MVLKEIRRSILFYIVKFDNLLLSYSLCFTRCFTKKSQSVLQCRTYLDGIKFYNKSLYFWYLLKIVKSLIL